MFALATTTLPSTDGAGTAGPKHGGGGGRPVDPRTRGLASQDIKRERRIRNRESAIRYRERRQSELNTCELRISELERETNMLRERLSKYEDLNSLNERCNPIEPAIF
jgi:hypothetical protein